jgi:hypothetical protein
MPLARLAVVAFGAALGCGCFASTGPVLGYIPGRGTTFGLEASAGSAVFSAKAGVTLQQTPKEGVTLRRRPAAAMEDWAGEAARPTDEDLGYELLPYLSVEPWVVLGGTFGLDLSVRSGPGYVTGVWEGLPVWGGPYGNSHVLGQCQESRNISWIATVAVGIRWWGNFRDARLGGASAQEFYVTPKFGVYCLAGDIL